VLLLTKNVSRSQMIQQQVGMVFLLDNYCNLLNLKGFINTIILYQKTPAKRNQKP